MTDLLPNPPADEAAPQPEVVDPDAPTRPLTPPAPEAIDLDADTGPLPVEAPAAPPPPKILIADDHPELRLALREVLEESFAGCEVLDAATAEEAVALAALSAPDVVVMDLRIPLMNGISATQAIKLVQPRTRVIMFSQHEDEAYQAQAGAAGASGYIYKREINQVLVPLMTELLRGEA